MKAHALVTNDDGIEAEGLASLRKMAEEFFDEVWLVAPASQMSEIGHRVTTQEPIRFEKREEKIFAVHGTPADCTRLRRAFNHLLSTTQNALMSLTVVVLLQRFPCTFHFTIC